ncbi:hypothetical protein [Streptomyces sp. BE147]|uniref:hypothetical protein n=1 Tax=unclassified Streptomyces TaxID=2593676 RepID=UPI002E786FB7|nr:hypothetical protein [Streptomyces sp. BE147]MEE1737610.1 hypothetical protein [Streptomyces sp. BE147]
MTRRSSADRARRRALLDAAAGLWRTTPYLYPAHAHRPVPAVKEGTPKPGGAQ